MQDETPLDALYRKFRRGDLERGDFEGELFRFVKGNPQRYRLGTLKEQQRDDFFGWIYPRLRRAIDAYRDLGSSFDAYLYTVVRWAIVDYRCENADREAVERAYWSERAQEAREVEVDYGQDTEGGATQRLWFKNPRQVLALTLKCCMFVSDDFCDRVAPSLNIGAWELREKIEILRRMIAERAERRRAIEERASTVYYRCIVLEAKIRQLPEGNPRRDDLERSLRFSRRLLASLRARAAAISLGASNREISRVLGIPKGTVDASLHFLKKRMARGGKGLSAPGEDRL